MNSRKSQKIIMSPHLYIYNGWILFTSKPHIGHRTGNKFSKQLCIYMVNELLRQRNKMDVTRKREIIYRGIDGERRSMVVDIYVATDCDVTMI